MSRVAFTLLALFMASVCLGVEFDANGKTGVVKAEAYEATIDKNGSFVLAVKDGVKVKSSFLECWRTRQEFPQIKLMTAELERSKNDEAVSFEFKYLWNKGEVLERLRFDCRGVDVSYVFTSDVKRPVMQYLICYLETASVSEMQAQARGDLQETISAKTDCKGKRFETLSFDAGGSFGMDYIAGEGCSFSIERFPAVIVRQRIPYGKFFVDAGESRSFSYFLRLRASGSTIPDSKVLFCE